MISGKNATDSSKFGPSQYIQMGPTEAKITKIEVVKSKDGEKSIPVLHFETRPLGGDFKGKDGALGQVANPRFGSYSINNASDGKFDETNNNFAHIAKLVGTREAFDKIEGSSIEDFCKKVEPLIKNKFLWWLFGGEEYQYTDNEGNSKVGIKTILPRYGFVADSKDKLQSIQKGGQFPSKDNPYYFKKLVKMDEDKPKFTDFAKNEEVYMDKQSEFEPDDSGLPF